MKHSPSWTIWLSPLGDVKTKKVKKVLQLLRDVGPSHPGLESHEYHSLKWPNKGRRVESYGETARRQLGGIGG